ncbi:inhibitor of KinA [Paenibacillus phyllosphaerae]|uniref:Inhibitor of KinA n=1 Tax=Paenibacillus phyllosphaerae TaxID=274593 RepID=A0A7W5ATI5_9BACL|nr:5-oxoprolinase subunit PxpB [Paenibacillus phyllosphaerae]MBB3108495.1 inhibitor of KinA [Paenibacillus phyllosphaerae]
MAKKRDQHSEEPSVPDREVYELHPLGDAAVLIRLGDMIDRRTNERVNAIMAKLAQDPIPGMIECVPAYTSVTVHYDPIRVHKLHTRAVQPSGSLYDSVCAMLEERMASIGPAAQAASRIVEIPVLYGGEQGPDLQYVADYHGLSVEEVVQLHSGGDYLVYMIGFAPGFPYMGGLPPRLATPRRATPRTTIPAGSVGIGGAQTGVYSLATPGGWHIIGRTPLALFRPDGTPPSYLAAGDSVKFRSISEEEYDQLAQEVLA